MTGHRTGGGITPTGAHPRWRVKRQVMADRKPRQDVSSNFISLHHLRVKLVLPGKDAKIDFGLSAVMFHRDQTWRFACDILTSPATCSTPSTFPAAKREPFQRVEGPLPNDQGLNLVLIGPNPLGSGSSTVAFEL